mgnify:CR=1 FL=1
MATNITYQQNVSPLDALWALYQSQTKKVKNAFRSRLLAEEENDKKAIEMKAYEKKLSPEVRTSVCMMAVAVKQGAEEARQAAANNTHVGRPAEDFLAELEKEDQ